jgi:hypothetical protein
MGLTWRGEEIKAKVRAAQIAAVDATMAAAILHAKANHGAGSHALQRFETQTGELERSLRIVAAAAPDRTGVVGRWGSVGLAYARRQELGFQGQDAAGRVVNAPAYPFLRPAAEAEYPKLKDRVRRAYK